MSGVSCGHMNVIIGCSNKDPYSRVEISGIQIQILTIPILFDSRKYNLCINGGHWQFGNKNSPRDFKLQRIQQYQSTEYSVILVLFPIIPGLYSPRIGQQLMS